MIPRVPELAVRAEPLDTDELVVADGPTFGLVDVRVVFPIGASGDGERAGLAGLSWELCERGTERHDRSEFHAALEKLGAELSLRSHRQSSEVSLRVLREDLGPALELVGDALLNARDDAEELDELREETSEGIAVSLESPDGAVSRCVPGTVWTALPWSVPMDGTERTRALIDVEACREQRRRVVRAPAIFGVAAEEPDTVVSEVRAFRERIRAAVGVEPVPDEIAPERRWGVARAVDFDAPQGALTVLSPGPDPRAPEWAAVALHAAAFGDGFTSPLVGALRARDGLSYDVGWSVHAEIGRSVHVFRCHPSAENVARAFAVAEEVWREAAFGVIDERSLARAKATYIGARLVALETAERRMASACILRRLGLPVERLWQLPARVAELGAAEVAAAADRYAWGTQKRTLVAALPGGAAAPQWDAVALFAELEPCDPEATR